MSTKPIPENCEVASDDSAAWAVEHCDWLRRLIQRRVKPLDCGDEVLQEVLIAASRSALTDVPAEQQAPWLTRVALRQCAMAWRSWTRRQRREDQYAASWQQRGGTPADDPIFGLIADEQRQLVRRQIGQLEPLYREILMLKYVNGCTYREIGQRLGMEVSAVEYRLALARRALRRALVDAGIDGSH